MDCAASIRTILSYPGRPAQPVRRHRLVELFPAGRVLRHDTGEADTEQQKGSRFGADDGDVGGAKSGAAEIAPAASKVINGAIAGDDVGIEGHRTRQSNGSPAHDIGAGSQSNAVTRKNIPGEGCAGAQGRGAANLPEYGVAGIAIDHVNRRAASGDQRASYLEH